MKHFIHITKFIGMEVGIELSNVLQKHFIFVLYDRFFILTVKFEI